MKPIFTLITLTLLSSSSLLHATKFEIADILELKEEEKIKQAIFMRIEALEAKMDDQELCNSLQNRKQALGLVLTGLTYSSDNARSICFDYAKDQYMKGQEEAFKIKVKRGKKKGEQQLMRTSLRKEEEEKIEDKGKDKVLTTQTSLDIFRKKLAEKMEVEEQSLLAILEGDLMDLKQRFPAVSEEYFVNQIMIERGFFKPWAELEKVEQDKFVTEISKCANESSKDSREQEEEKTKDNSSPSRSLQKSSDKADKGKGENSRAQKKVISLDTFKDRLFRELAWTNQTNRHYRGALVMLHECLEITKEVLPDASDRMRLQNIISMLGPDVFTLWEKLDEADKGKFVDEILKQK